MPCTPLSSELDHFGSKIVQIPPFKFLKDPELYRRQLPEYSVVTTGVEKHRARAPAGAFRDV